MVLAVVYVVFALVFGAVVVTDVYKDRASPLATPAASAVKTNYFIFPTNKFSLKRLILSLSSSRRFSYQHLSSPCPLPPFFYLQEDRRFSWRRCLS